MELIRLQIKTEQKTLQLDFSKLRAEGVFCLGIPPSKTASAREKELYRFSKAIAVLLEGVPTTESEIVLTLQQQKLFMLSYKDGVRTFTCDGVSYPSECYAKMLMESGLTAAYTLQVISPDTAKQMLLGEKPFYDTAAAEAFLDALALHPQLSKESRERLCLAANGVNRCGLHFVSELTAEYLERICYLSGRYLEKLSSYRYRFLYQSSRLLLLDLHTGTSSLFEHCTQRMQFLAALSLACGMHEMNYEKEGLHFPYLLQCDSFDPEQIDTAAVRSYFYKLAKRDGG